MKDTTKKKLLQIIWDECSFDEIINAGFDLNKCSSSDIINAASDYEDPEKSVLEDNISESSIEDVMDAVKSEFTIEDIVSELNKDDILWYLEGSYELENHDDDVRKEYHDALYEEIIEEVESIYDFNYKQFVKDIAEKYSPDDYHKLICNILGVGYYDKDEFKEKIKEFINKLNKNNYNIKYNEN